MKHPMRAVYALAIVAAALPAPGHAQSSDNRASDNRAPEHRPAGAGGRSQAAMLAHKATLVDKTLNDSPVATRIAASSNAEAKAHMAAAADLLAGARRDADAGEVAAADRRLNEAMVRIARARALEPQPPGQRPDDANRYAQLMRSVESLEAAYLRNVVRVSPLLAQIGDEDLDRTRLLVERARALGNAGQFGQANDQLERAQRGLMASHQKLLGTAPLVYDRRFAMPEDEYDFEVDRNRDYARLVPIAIGEFQPPRDAQHRAEQLAAQGKQLAARAAAAAERGQYRPAIRLLHESTELMQRALESAGLVVPSRMPAQDEASNRAQPR